MHVGFVPVCLRTDVFPQAPGSSWQLNIPMAVWEQLPTSRSPGLGWRLWTRSIPATQVLWEPDILRDLCLFTFNLVCLLFYCTLTVCFFSFFQLSFSISSKLS